MAREKRTYLDRLKTMPGNQQAFMLTMKAARRASCKENGETDQEKYHELKLKITKKVAELWGLSPMMEQYIIQRWVEGKAKLKVKIQEKDYPFLGIGLFSDRSKTTGHDLELEILFTGKDIPELSSINSKLEILETRLITNNQIRKNHIYLDVTGLDYQDLRIAYKTVNKCRKLLGIDFKDVRTGAPESMDFTTALLTAMGEERGLSRKKIAEIMGFKIYSRDNPSGSYPLLQKYLKVGKWILCRLNKLEEYIHEVTGIDTDTL